MSKKDSDQLLRQIRKIDGISIKIGGSNHYKIYWHDRLVTTMPVSASDVRGPKNARAVLKKAGVPL